MLYIKCSWIICQQMGKILHHYKKRLKSYDTLKLWVKICVRTMQCCFSTAIHFSFNLVLVQDRKFILVLVLV